MNSVFIGNPLSKVADKDDLFDSDDDDGHAIFGDAPSTSVRRRSPSPFPSPKVISHRTCFMRRLPHSR